MRSKDFAASGRVGVTPSRNQLELEPKTTAELVQPQTSQREQHPAPVCRSVEGDDCRDSCPYDGWVLGYSHGGEGLDG